VDSTQSNNTLRRLAVFALHAFHGLKLATPKWHRKHSDTYSVLMSCLIQQTQHKERADSKCTMTKKKKK